MFNRKIIYARPTFPRRFGKKRKQHRKPNFGAFGEFLFILFLIGVFLFACFVGIPL